MSMNDYKLEKQIGSGTFGDVYKGVEISTGNKVAIKRIRKKVLYENGKYLLKAYFREIKIMEKCACENSIKFIKEFPTQTNYNIIMELCDTDLICYLYERPNPFSVDEVRDTFAQLNNAFKKMSQHHILHRDLKLGNVLIKFTDDSKTHFIPKLSDYGFSKELNNYNYAACTHLGTPATMAPEIMMNRPYDEKSDLWSVGVMMYQLYYREVPVEGNSENEILKKIQTCPFKQPEDPNFRDLINKLLVIDPSKRLSWKEYFKHPFFKTSKFYKQEFENENANNSFEYNSDNNGGIFNAFDLSVKSASSEFGYSYSSEIFGDEYGFSEGNLYGNIQKSSRNLQEINNIFNQNDNFESKIKLYERGQGINDKEYEIIIKICIETQDNNLGFISNECNNKIKNILNGLWFVFICNEEEANYDFYFSNKFNDRYVIFKYGNNLFQIYQIK